MNPITWLMSRGKRKQYLEEVNRSLASKAVRESGTHSLTRDMEKHNEFVVVNDKDNMWRIVPVEKADEYMRMVKEQRA